MITNRGKQPRTIKQAGFTIVEVMIVLAVAGLIMLLVFEAIPALTRSSANNQRKQDTAAILARVSHYELNNSGRFPSSSSFLSSNDLKYYDVSNVTLTANKKTTTNAPTDLDTAAVYNYQKCDPDNPGTSVGKGADYSSIVVLYAIATSGGTSGRCAQL